MPGLDRVCLECGHEYAWHVRERATKQLGIDPGLDRSCYRQISGRPCPCAEFRAGPERLMTVPSTTSSVVRNGVLTVLLLVLGLALLYAYRAQTPAIQTIPITEAIRAVRAGEVKALTITANKATLEFADGTKRQTNLPEGARGDDPLSQAVAAYNKANPARAVVLRYEPAEPGFSAIGSILLGLLPVLLIGGFFFYMMNTMRRRRND